MSECVYRCVTMTKPEYPRQVENGFVWGPSWRVETKQEQAAYDAGVREGSFSLFLWVAIVVVVVLGVCGLWSGIRSGIASAVAERIGAATPPEAK